VNSVARMRRDWESEAGSDPMYYIDARQRDWTLAEFYAGGPELVARFVTLALAALGVDPAGRRVLEIGCGMGRCSRPLGSLRRGMGNRHLRDDGRQRSGTLPGRRDRGSSVTGARCAGSTTTAWTT
jgi:hypothetical protein